MEGIGIAPKLDCSLNDSRFTFLTFYDSYFTCMATRFTVLIVEVDLASAI
jgi:hypothetical protein